MVGKDSLPKRVMIIMCFSLYFSPIHAAVGDRHFEQTGGFSFQAPAGWLFRDFPGRTFQIAYGPMVKSFNPNINIADETYTGDLKSYVDLNIINAKKFFTKFSLINRESFITSKDIIGEKVITTSRQQNVMLRQIFYFFPGTRGKYICIACCSLASDKDLLDPVFDESMQTFETIPAATE